MGVRHPLLLLRGEMPVPTNAVPGVVPQRSIIPGTAFFPGGWGIWGTAQGTPVPPMPFGGVMVVGQDFDSEHGLKRSVTAGYEVRVDQNGSYDASRSPTWRALLPLLAAVEIQPADCFFTNAYMGIRSGAKSTGQFPGSRSEEYRLACQNFFLQQLAAQRPKLVVTLGRWVPPFLADLSPELASWRDAQGFADLDAAGPVRGSVVFRGQRDECCVVALTHPSYRRANVWRRKYNGLTAENAEVAMLRDGLRIAGVHKPPNANGDDSLSRIEANFHGLIHRRAKEGRLDQPLDLPKIGFEMLEEKEQRWFPVPGMYGGFAYRLRRRGETLALVTESWSRVVDGSGQRHLVTTDAVVLEEEGFV
jgi:hypothetical protein